MRYKLLGKSGLRVSEICLGTMTFGENWGWGASREESLKMYDLFRETGGNFIDTANRYTEGTSESFLGEFMHSHREEIVLATKYTLFERRNDVNGSGNSRKNMMQTVEHSLKRLKTEYLDLLYVHAWDFTTPEEEVMRALDDLVRQGKVMYLGISDTPAWIVSRSNTIAELRGWTQFVAYQLEYSLIQRTPERDMIPLANHMDLGVAVWAPLAGGALTGKYLNENPDAKRLKEGSPRLNERSQSIAREVVAVAREIGCTPAQVAMNWVRKQPGIMLPIIGARTAEQLRDSLGCLNFDLPEPQLQRLNEISKIEVGFPHDFLASDGVRDIAFGGTYARIDNHHF
jgi:aryl-alcohol dehydrogenase-like predicted oxidoreductase